MLNEQHLKLRVHMLRTGIFKTDQGRRSWEFFKLIRDDEFRDWFEREIFGSSEELDKFREEFYNKNDRDSSRLMNIFRK